MNEILKIVKSHCDANTLVPIEPLIQSDPLIRRLYVLADIKKKLDGPWKTKKEAEQWSTVRALMDNFVSGRTISMSMEKNNKTRHHMARLKPYEEGVWEMRATIPKPGLRILGQFVEKDFFIATEWQERTLLGTLGSREWRNLIVKCQTKWRNLFYNYHSLKGDNPHEYLSKIYFD